MIITIVFDYPDVDPDSEEASEIFDTLYDDLEEFGYETGNIWYMDDWAIFVKDSKFLCVKDLRQGVDMV